MYLLFCFLQFYYLYYFCSYTLICTYIWSLASVHFGQCFIYSLSLFLCVCVYTQVRGDSNGGVGSVVDGLSFSEYQAICGELLTHGSQTAGIQRTRFTSAGHQLGKFVCVTEEAWVISAGDMRDSGWRWEMALTVWLPFVMVLFFSFFSLFQSPALSAHSMFCCIIPHLGLSYLLTEDLGISLQRVYCIELFACFEHCIICWSLKLHFSITWDFFFLMSSQEQVIQKEFRASTYDDSHHLCRNF